MCESTDLRMCGHGPRFRLFAHSLSKLNLTDIYYFITYQLQKFLLTHGAE